MAKIVSIEEILNDLENGLTRKPSSIGYEPLIGSISEKYGLDNNQLTLLFNHPQLKGKKTKKQSTLIIVDTVQEKEERLRNQENHENQNVIEVEELLQNKEEEELITETVSEIKEIEVTLETQNNVEEVSENVPEEVLEEVQQEVEEEEDSLF